jgi:hypothetical protein
VKAHLHADRLAERLAALLCRPRRRQLRRQPPRFKDDYLPLVKEVKQAGRNSGGLAGACRSLHDERGMRLQLRGDLGQ